MVTTNFLVKKRKISQLDSVPYTGEYNIDTFHFEFDEEWEGLDKTLVIVTNNERYNVALLNDVCVIPPEFYTYKGNVLIGLFGTYEGQYQTLATGWLTIYIEDDSYEAVEPENLPTPTQWDLYVTEINRLLTLCETSEENCQAILEQMQADYEQYVDELNQIKSDTEDIKEDTQTIYTQTNQIKTDVQTLKGQIEHDIADANLRIDEYNANAQAKTNTFNQNATQKTNTFNSNATEKTNTFDGNATNKTTTFNNNATQKTNDFNQNATQKTATFDENYTEKLGNISTAGETAVDNIETAEGEAIEHIQAQGLSYENRIQLLEDNFDTATSPNSNNYVIEDSASAYNRGNIKIGDGPELEQGENPSPDNPQDITVVEGESDINISNANLFDKNSTNFFKTYIGQTPHAISTASDDNNYRTYYMECLPNTNYYLKKFDVASAVIAGTCPTTPAKGTVLNDYKVANASTHKLSILTSSNAKYLVFQVYGASAGYTLDEVLNSFYIGKTDVEPTKYVPHKGQTYPITLPEGMFLGAIGEASNYIYGTKDNWKLHNDIVKNRGSINVTAVDTQEDYTIALVSKYNIGLPTGKYTNYAKFDKFKEVDSSNDYQVGKFNTSINKDIIYFCIPATITTVADAKAYLDGLNMTRYIITTRWAEDTDITDQTLITQLNNIADNLQTYKDQTIVFTSSENLEPNMQFKYAQNPLANVNSEISDIKNAILSLGGEV